MSPITTIQNEIKTVKRLRAAKLSRQGYLSQIQVAFYQAWINDLQRAMEYRP